MPLNLHKRDPQQMNNLYGTSAELLGTSMKHLENRLDALTMVLKTCSGQRCQEPWRALHPTRPISTIREAVHADFDDFYAAQPKVKFENCLAGYFFDNEHPHFENVFGGLTVQGQRDLDAWSEYWMVAG